MPLTPFDPTQPLDNGFVSAGAAAIRNLTTLIINFLSVSFNMTTGQLLATAVPNPVTTPYGTAGYVYTSTGVSTPPSWTAPGTLITGMIVPWPVTTPPTGWLNCDGSTPLIATYPTLASLIGTTFGGDGSTTFGLPDTRGRSLIGIGTGTASDATTWTLNEIQGTETHTLVTGEMPSHVHSTSWAQYSGQHQNGTQPAGVYPVVTGVGSTNTASTGGDGAHNNIHPVIGMNFIIKT